MIIYSFQSKEIINFIVNHQIYITDINLFKNHYNNSNEDFKEWKDAYDWLCKKMIQKIGKPDDPKIKYPVWGWHTYNWACPPKFDVKNIKSLPYENDWEVMLKLNIPDNKVVLSDELQWTSGPLNNFFLCSKYITSDEEFDNEYNAFESLSISEKQKAIYKSWDIIFDITPFDNGYSRQGQYVQATFWEIKPEYILEYFVNN